MTRLALVFAALVLALPASALAKGISGATVCGADGCQRVSDRAVLDRLAEGGPPATRDIAPEGFFRVRFTVDHGGEEIGRFGVLLAPRAGAVQAEDGTWLTLSAANRRAYRRLTAGRTPFPARDMPSGAVAPEPVAQVDAVYPAPPGDDARGGAWMLAIAAAAAVAAGLLAALRPGRPRPRRSPAARPGA